MQHILENDQLTVTIAAHGAEVQSVQRKPTRQEYIWTAHPDVWARHAPVLFPIVGRLKNDEYQWNGEPYHMSQHGFAREQDFKVIEQTSDRIVYGLTANKQTTEQYPFNFTLDITYQLMGDQLEVGYRVINHDQAEMPFSIGGHPGFLCPAQVNGQPEDYYLEFEQEETLARHLLEGGLRTGETRPVIENSRQLLLQPQLFKDDALIFTGFQSDWVRIVRRSNDQPVITVTIDGFPYLGIWQKVGADFYCIEPWYGWADSTTASGELIQKDGIQILQPENRFETSYRWAFH